MNPQRLGSLRWAAAAAILNAGCASLGGRGGSHEMGPPSVDRCEQSPAQAQAACAQARTEATQRVRKLYVDDQVCIDGRQPLDSPGQGCTVRAFVEGVTGHQLQLEIREAPEDGPYKVMENWWFDEAALVDIQLQALGYGSQDARP